MQQLFFLRRSNSDVAWPTNWPTILLNASILGQGQFFSFLCNSSLFSDNRIRTLLGQRNRSTQPLLKASLNLRREPWVESETTVSFQKRPSGRGGPRPWSFDSFSQDISRQRLEDMIRRRLNGYLAQRVPRLFLASSFRNCLDYAVLKCIFAWRTRYPLS